MCARHLTLLLALVPAAAIAATSVREAPVIPPPFRLLAEPAVVKDLSLRPGQLEDVRHLRSQRVEEIAKTVTNGKRYGELAEDEPKVRELIQKELSLDDAPSVAGASRAVTAVNVLTDMYREAVEKQCWDVLDRQQQSTAKNIFGRGRE